MIVFSKNKIKTSVLWFARLHLFTKLSTMKKIVVLQAESLVSLKLAFRFGLGVPWITTNKKFEWFLSWKFLCTGMCTQVSTLGAKCKYWILFFLYQRIEATESLSYNNWQFFFYCLKIANMDKPVFLSFTKISKLWTQSTVYIESRMIYLNFLLSIAI